MKTVKLFGPPGTGKTHALLRIMEDELASGVRPERMAYLTFTVAARREAMNRAREKFGFTREQLPYFRTLHSIAYRELNLNRASMIRDELRDFAELVGVEITPPRWQADDDAMGLDVPAGGLMGDKLLTLDHFMRHNLYTLEEAYRRWREEIPWYLVKRFSTAYDRWKSAEGLYDFTDLLVQAHDPLPVDVVLVDEAQDLSLLQWRALDMFAARAQRLYVAGDDDQAIFTWAGASPRAFLERSGRNRVLGQSYRLPRAVHRFAHTLVEGIHDRKAKEFKPRDAEGSVSLVMEPDYVDFDREGTWLILYRNHYLAGDYEERLRQLGMPYAKSDRPAPGAQWGEAIVLWERLRRGREVTQREALKVLEAMRALPRDAVRKLRRRADDEPVTLAALRELGILAESPWFEALGKIDEAEVEYLRRVIQHHGSAALTAPPRYRLSTIHAAKGAQADHVVLATDVSRKVRESMDESDEDERRVFYVGVTRARESLTLVGAHNPLFR